MNPINAVSRLVYNAARLKTNGQRHPYWLGEDLELIICRPVSFPNSRWITMTDETGQTVSEELNPSELQEGLYFWSTGGIDPLMNADAKQSAIWHKRIVEPFSLAQPAERRTIAEFEKAVRQLPHEIFEEPDRDWSSVVAGMETVEANLMLALTNHLWWICSMFLEVPNLTVVIR